MEAGTGSRGVEAGSRDEEVGALAALGSAGSAFVALSRHKRAATTTGHMMEENSQQTKALLKFKQVGAAGFRTPKNDQLALVQLTS